MASLSSLTFASAALLLLLLLCSAAEVNGRRAQGKQREFDYFKLALQWPGTSCQRSRRCCPTNGCCSKSNSLNDFTIHGLWPDYDDGSWPACCKRSNFDESLIAKLHSKLEKNWPSYSCVKTSTCYSGKGSFWAHEWEKHGTCSAPVVQDEYSYFLTALNIFYKYNVTRVLLDAGYEPSNTEKYPVGGVIAAIQTAFHINPEVMCVGGSVQEIRLCFHKDFKPRDCGADKLLYGVNASSNSCPKTVSLPLRGQPKAGKVKMVTSSASASQSEATV